MIIVIKIGTNVILRDDEINEHLLNNLAETLSAYQDLHQIAIVTSGAVASGAEGFDLKNLVDNQAAAAIGQSKLMAVYGRIFGKYGLRVAQLLYTYPDLVKQRTRKVIDRLLAQGIVPIINENDPVTSDEILEMTAFGDNARLAALVARMIRADLLVLLSNVDGLYPADPRQDKQVRPIKTVRRITSRILKMASAVPSAHSKGGMRANVAAVQLAREKGIPSIIANGCRWNTLRRILEGKYPGTYFPTRRRR